MPTSVKWERIQAALTSGSVDRPAFGFWMHLPNLDRDPVKLARATVDLYRRYDMDYVKVMFRSSWGLEDWGWRPDFYHPTRGFWLPAAYPVKAPEDWTRLQPLRPDEGALGEQLRLLRLIHDMISGEAPVLATLFAPSMLAAQLAGQQPFVQHLRQAPDAVHAGLRTISRTLAEFARACLSNGADGVFYAINLANRNALPEEEYRALGRAYDRPLIEAFHEQSKLTMLHLHGDQLYFDELASYPAHVLNWYDRCGGPSLKEARSRTNLCLAGGIDHERTLMLGTDDEVEAEVRDAVSQVEGRGLLLAPGCGVPTTVSTDRLRALTAAATGVDR